MILLWRAKSETIDEEDNNTGLQKTSTKGDTKSIYKYDRVSIPALNVNDLFDDAYTSIARDGAANIEVALRIQKSLNTIKACFNDVDKTFVEAASVLAKQSYERGMMALDYEQDKKRLTSVYKGNNS